MDDENPELDKTRLRVQIVITAVLGGFCIYLIACESQDSSKIKWAYGIIGLLVGYWLK